MTPTEKTPTYDSNQNQSTVYLALQNQTEHRFGEIGELNVGWKKYRTFFPFTFPPKCVCVCARFFQWKKKRTDTFWEKSG